MSPDPYGNEKLIFLTSAVAVYSIPLLIIKIPNA